MTDTIEIDFDDFISISELLNAHNAVGLSIVDINIGYDNKIYILLNSNIPERINGRFVDTVAHADYFVLELSVDWKSGTLTNSNYYELGKHDPNFHFIQPIKDKLLLGARTYYCNDLGSEENALLYQTEGSLQTILTKGYWGIMVGMTQ